MRIASVGSALPQHFYDQETILSRLEGAWAERHFNLERLRQLHHNVLVGGRHLALPIDDYQGLTTFGQSNAAWLRVGLEVGAAALLAALERAGLERERIAALYFVSVTGLSVPSLDARLMNRMGLPVSTKRVPIFGLGCVAGAAGIARCADYVRAFPDEVAVLLSVELCSLTLQRGDLSIPNLVASGLFGDGAAAVAVAGAAVGPTGDAWGPEVVATRSAFYPDTEHVMGWDISESGFKVVLSADVPDMVVQHLRRDVDAFLAEQGLSLGDVASFVCHPGGPKVLEAMERALELPPDALELTWRSLREVGNLSSTSVLLVLERTMSERRPPSGSFGLLLAMGPGFCSELVLLRW
ncbi:MAG TPA: 3-oxoacyl-[acyl-carrier-protein] synthase III C-terminal domain-containing protein [Thermoanaerobaculia bacterium]|nr:3-oxoacyl-[acyl-carrier-protein] synthase III C-terminal domain-containing protein [Thermoanaerobaculia bacterium]